jgi:hypothetical protein
MKLNRTFCVANLAALALALFALPSAHAVCGVPKMAATPSSFHPQLGRPHLLNAAYNPFEEFGEQRIVGFWHVKFVSKGSGASAADGKEIDAGYSQWHSDHTEIMNSAGRSPLMGDFCLGVWKQVGERTYLLNHFAAGWDGNGMNLIGPANIRETVTVDRDGDSFKGTFTIDQYTEAGNVAIHFQGTITGTRITVSTPPTSIF